MEQGVDSSRKALVEAVRYLLPRRAWHRVSVQLICDTANVSRSTFYTHFDDKQSLLDLVFEALKSGLSLEANGRGLDRHGNFRCLPWLVTHMEGHLPLFELNRTYPSGPALFEQFRDVVDGAMQQEIAESCYAGKIIGRHHDFLVGGVFGMLERWCADNCLEPGATILDELDKYVGIVLSGEASAGTATKVTP